MCKQRNCFNNRWKVRVFLILPTAVVYMLLYVLSDSINISFEFNELLANVVVGNFGITITAVSIFAVFEKSGKLLKESSKIWFIDAIILALLDLIFSLIFGTNDKQAMVFIVLISCYHTYMIFHYYLRERFLNEKDNKKIVNCEFPHFLKLNGGDFDNEMDNITKSIDTENDKKFKIPYFTIVDTFVLLLPAILFLRFDFVFYGNSTLQEIFFYTIFAIYILGCLLFKELYIEENTNIVRGNGVNGARKK